MDLYIYYRVAEADSHVLQAEVATMQRGLRSKTGVRCGLKQRREAVDGRITWMEIYLTAPHDLEALIDAALEQTRLPALIEGRRHTEYFLDRLPCA